MDLSVGDLRGADARRAVLIVAIMTVHSFAEGVGIGVAFAGREALAWYVTLAIAVQNIPEGLAIALVLVPRGVSVAAAAGWSVVSSLPQPLMALPAFAAVRLFEPMLPFGLGFAAGAMIWMVFADLYPDALEGERALPAATVVLVAFTAMLALQRVLLNVL
jgi:zinc transporter ZupT